MVDEFILLAMSPSGRAKIDWDGPNLKVTNATEANDSCGRRTARAGRCNAQGKRNTGAWSN